MARTASPDDAEALFRDAIQRIESVRAQLQLSQKSDFLADKRDVYDALIKLLLERSDVAAAFDFMERSRARAFQDRFYNDKLSPDALTLGSIQSRLDPQTALIEFWAGAEGSGSNAEKIPISTGLAHWRGPDPPRHRPAGGILGRQGQGGRDRGGYLFRPQSLRRGL